MSNFSKVILKGKKNLEKEFEKKKEFINEKKKLFELKKQLKAKNSELNELYEAYGKACYEGQQDINIEDSISEVLENIIDLEMAIREMEDFKADMIFCSKCGKKL